MAIKLYERVVFTVKIIGILLIIVGALGIFLSMNMVGDIGYAGLIGSISGLLSGIGFLIVGKKLNK